MPLDHLMDSTRSSGIIPNGIHAGLMNSMEQPDGHADHIGNLYRARTVEVHETTALQFGFSPSDAHYLAHVGLPAWPAPDLWFHSPAMLAPDYIRLGEDRDEREIFYDPSTSIVYCQRDVNGSVAPRIVCTGIVALGAILAAYASMIDQAMNACGRRVVIENNIPDHLIDAFEQAVTRIDPSAVGCGHFWQREMERLRSHLPE